jgi:hypothetical protein
MKSSPSVEEVKLAAYSAKLIAAQGGKPRVRINVAREVNINQGIIWKGAVHYFEAKPVGAGIYEIIEIKPDLLK